jgi:hypothetical protein
VHYIALMAAFDNLSSPNNTALQQNLLALDDSLFELDNLDAFFDSGPNNGTEEDMDMGDLQFLQDWPELQHEQVRNAGKV